MGLRLGTCGNESDQVELGSGKRSLSHWHLEACPGFLGRLADTLEPWGATGKLSWIGPDFFLVGKAALGIHFPSVCDSGVLLQRWRYLSSSCDVLLPTL